MRKLLIVTAGVRYLTILSFACARDLTTTTGETFHDIKVTRIEKTGIGIMHRDGVAFLDFLVLPPEVRREFGYAEAAYAQGRIEQGQREEALRLAAQAAAEEQARRTAEAAAAPQARTQYYTPTAADFSLPTYRGRSFAGDYSRQSQGSDVFVQGYYKSNGTYVHSHTRSYPHSHK
jgi:hypothetical protein